MFKDFPYAIVHFGGTFEVLCRSDFTGNCLALQVLITLKKNVKGVDYFFGTDGSLLGFT
jgi:hypothetical protein